MGAERARTNVHGIAPNAHPIMAGITPIAYISDSDIGHRLGPGHVYAVRAWPLVHAGRRSVRAFRTAPPIAPELTITERARLDRNAPTSQVGSSAGCQVRRAAGSRVLNRQDRRPPVGATTNAATERHLVSPGRRGAPRSGIGLLADACDNLLSV